MCNMQSDEKVGIGWYHLFDQKQSKSSWILPTIENIQENKSQNQNKSL